MEMWSIQEWKWLKKAGQSKRTMVMSFIVLIFLLCAVALLQYTREEEQGIASLPLCTPQHTKPPLLDASRVEQSRLLCGDDDHDDCPKEERGAVDGRLLPRGIIRRTTDLEFRSLSGENPIPEEQQILAQQLSRNLLAIPVGFKQKDMIDKIIRKFSLTNFTIMLFHYDGIIDKWKEFPWNDRVIHVGALNQTKWWFAKRFLHPDIVAPYKYIFLWDEDIGLENFDPNRYLSIVESEGFEISQPALDRKRSRIHHEITLHQPRKHVHRRIYRSRGSVRCFENSTQPPCTGWVEMMVPVFSQAAWRCIWYMIQNDLVYAWGMDMKLGYCVQGNRSQKVGVVDDEYVVHYGVPSLGGQSYEKANQSYSESATDRASRDKVRKRSYEELRIFNTRWDSAVEEDRSWTDPYQ